MNYIGQKITRECTVRDANGDLIDAPDLTFNWQLGDYCPDVNAITPDHISTGRYQVVFTVDDRRGGIVYYRWDTESDLDVAKEGRLYIKPSVFELT